MAPLFNLKYSSINFSKNLTHQHNGLRSKSRDIYFPSTDVLLSGNFLSAFPNKLLCIFQQYSCMIRVFVMTEWQETSRISCGIYLAFNSSRCDYRQRLLRSFAACVVYGLPLWRDFRQNRIQLMGTTQIRLSRDFTNTGRFFRY